MRRLLLAAAAIASLGGAPTLAQSAATIASPLGVIGSTLPTTPGGIGLGVSELNPGGLSPIPPGAVGCSSNAGGGATSGAPSTFDGGGTGGTMSASTPCLTVAGTPAASTTNGAASSGGAGIPLGASEIGNAGISPILAAPSSNGMAVAPTDSSAGEPMAAGTPVAPDIPPPPSLIVVPCDTGSAMAASDAEAGNPSEATADAANQSSC